MARKETGISDSVNASKIVDTELKIGDDGYYESLLENGETHIRVSRLSGSIFKFSRELFRLSRVYGDIFKDVFPDETNGTWLILVNEAQKDLAISRLKTMTGENGILSILENSEDSEEE